ncbi:MAG: U32 family peptidase [Clostridia bacterium]|nr:U32 family peptidase [Clostridia bacterium]
MKMEVLAPAGDRTALERAAAAGADAVYLGYASFSARAGAANFDTEGLTEAIRFAHLHHIRVYVTVNTLVKDAELAEILSVLRLLRDLKADGVLVQDPGVLRLAEKCFPGLPVHASTQMAIHNRTGVRWCARKGMKRVVLARECSAAEIRKCTQEPIEVEVFVHGAQCTAVSGMCLFSSMAGERSGNRGRCAQPCRLEYVYRGRRGAWLSPRDVCLRNDLPVLRDAGAASLKIEGRLKRPEYVAVVTRSYREAVDALYSGTFTRANESEETALKQIFQRGGFMRGYAMACEDAGVICPERVSHAGVRIGVIDFVGERLAGIRTERTLHDGDALQIRHGANTEDVIYSGKETAPGGAARLWVRDGLRIAKGDEVVRLADALQLREAMAMQIGKIPVSLCLRAMPGEPLRLEADDGNVRAVCTGDTVQTAKTRPSTGDDLKKNLGKTGDTPFVCQQITVETENAFVPVSALNALRRETLERLSQERADAFAYDTSGEGNVPDDDIPARDLPEMVIYRDPAGIRPEAGRRAILYPEDYRTDALEKTLNECPDGIWLHLPPVCEESTLTGLARLTERFSEKLGGVVLGSIGQLGIDWKVPYGAGAGIPVLNRQAVRFLLDEGCEFVTASPELTERETRALCAGKAPVTVRAYCREQLMILHHCPARTLLGLTKGHRECTMCDRNTDEALRGSFLTDRRGAKLPLERIRLPEGCLVRVRNIAVTDILQHCDGLYRTMEDLPGEENAEHTSGHWYRATE